MVNLYSSARDDPFTWVLAARITLTFLVPWLNATMGIAIGLRHGNPPPVPGGAAGSGSSPNVPSAGGHVRIDRLKGSHMALVPLLKSSEFSEDDQKVLAVGRRRTQRY